MAINLKQVASEFLTIFKTFKVVRLLADKFGEIIIDWQVKDTVAVSFAEHKELLPLAVYSFLRAEFLVRETVERFKLQAKFENEENNEDITR